MKTTFILEIGIENPSPQLITAKKVIEGACLPQIGTMVDVDHFPFVVKNVVVDAFEEVILITCTPDRGQDDNDADRIPEWKSRLEQRGWEISYK